MKQIWNIIKYLIIFCANLLMLFFLHAYFNLIILIIMLLLPVFSVIIARFVLRRMDISFAGARENMRIEDPFVLKVVLGNPTIFPILNVNVKLHTSNDFFELSGDHILNIPAYALKENDIVYPLKSEYLGVLKIEAADLQVTDWMGFFVFHKKVEAKKELVILPFATLQMEPDLTAVSGGMTELEESRKKGHDFSEVQDVREYQPGDKLQNIHWKLSAKKDMLMVKERVSMSSSQLIVLIELYQNEAMILNRILTAAYGISDFLIQNQIPFVLRWWSVRDQDMKLQYVDNRTELDAWMESIYYERFYKQADLGYMTMQRLVAEDTRFVVVGSVGTGSGNVLLQYGGDVEGYLCN